MTWNYRSKLFSTNMNLDYLLWGKKDIECIPKETWALWFSFVCSHTHFNKCDGKHKFIKYHDYKNLNKDNLERDLNNASWDTAFESKVLMKFLIYWKKCLMRFLIAIIIPLKTKRVKRQTQPAWMTTEVHKSIKTWEKLLRRVWKTNK